MSKSHSDISDNEIRIISSNNAGNNPKRKFLKYYILIGAVIILGVLLLWLIPWGGDTDDDTPEPLALTELTEKTVIEPDTTATIEKAYTNIRKIQVNGTHLLILNPENASPSLSIGAETLNDSTAVLAVQAADIRADNGQIAGTYVLNGDLISKGEAKAGFCSIINGVLTIGISDSTPMLEQALASGGYFFRQFPLVVGGQIVENKSKRKALRKALAEIDGKICVVMSEERLTFHNFSQALIDAGVRNAIYLVGGYSPGIYVNEAGEKKIIGTLNNNPSENVNYIVWR